MGILQRVERYPKSVIIALGWFMLVMTAAIDYATGPDLSFLIFYFFPIFIFAWCVSRRAANVMGVVSGAAWIMADAFGREHYSHPLVPYWNLCFKGGIFLVIANLLSELKRALDHEKQLARTDPLTGVANRRSFIETAMQELERARRYSHPVTLAYVDIDDFKQINDQGGHLFGDAVLQETALVMEGALRQIDLLARMGGDEFAVLLPEVSPEEAGTAMQKVRQALLDLVGDRNWPITFSVGVTSFVRYPATVDEMVHLADDLMYSVKKDGKNQVACRTV